MAKQKIILDNQTNTLTVMNINGKFHSLVLGRQEGEMATIAINGDIKMLKGRWDIVKRFIDNYFDEQQIS